VIKLMKNLFYWKLGECDRGRLGIAYHPRPFGMPQMRGADEADAVI
jgi:hypothetical protein